MKRRVHFELKVANDADGTQIRDAVIGDLTGKDVFAQDIATNYSNTVRSRRRVTGRLRFNSTLDANNLLNQIESKWTSGALRNKILVGSKANIHNRSHDDPVILNCSTQSFSERVKV